MRFHISGILNMPVREAALIARTNSVKEVFRGQFNTLKKILTFCGAKRE
jgi:hypothetical protein